MKLLFHDVYKNDQILQSMSEAPTTDSSDKKKIMKIVGIVVIALLVVFLFYFFVFREGPYSLSIGAKSSSSTSNTASTGPTKTGN